MFKRLGSYSVPVVQHSFVQMNHTPEIKATSLSLSLLIVKKRCKRGEGLLTRSLGKQESICVSDVAMMTSVHMTTNRILTGMSHFGSPSLVNGVQPNWREGGRGRDLRKAER